MTDSGSLGDSGSGGDSVAGVDSDSGIASGSDSGTIDPEDTGYDDTIIQLDGGDFTAYDGDETPRTGANLGFVTHFVGDVWGDGYPEVVSAAWYSDEEKTDASVYVVDSATIDVLGSEASILDATRLVIHSDGRRIEPYPLGDLDGDGLGEIMISSAGLGISPAIYWGSRLAHESGTLDAGVAGDLYISSYAGTEGLDGGAGFITSIDHSYRDLVLTLGDQIVVIPAIGLDSSSYLVDGVGEAIIYSDSGGAGTPDPYTDMGVSTVLGDIDGDGLNEIAAESWGTPMGVLVEVVYGDSLSVGTPMFAEDADVLFTFPTLVDEFGDSFLIPTPLGDVDGDGVDDLTLSRGDIDADGLVERGVAWLWSGARLSTPAVLDPMDGDVEFVSTHHCSQVGGAVADVGDMDGDDLSDFLIHGSGRDGGEAESILRPFVHLFRGSDVAGGGTFDVDHASIGFQSSEPMSCFSEGGYDGGQDIDGDGINDLLIGNGDYRGGEIGRVWLVPGSFLSF